MQIKNFIGVDVSKKTLDISVVNNDGLLVYYKRINNCVSVIRKAVSSIMKQLDSSLTECVFCMEYTGIYNFPLIKFLEEKSGKVWMESGIQISRSMGVTRGKNDKVDSQRIAMYGYTHRHRIKLWEAPREVISQLSQLLSQRSRLIKAKKQLSVPVEEQKTFVPKAITKMLQNNNRKSIEALSKAIKLIEKQILSLIKEDKKLKRLYEVITSVNGVGLVTAVQMLTTTNEFINIQDPRKYACYSGVAPFEHSSGTSVRGKNRVSHKANKKVKTVLHLAALAAIKTEGDIKDYYNRKVQEGKNKMSVLNAIRNKLIHRVFSCVRTDRMYTKVFQHELA